MKEIVFPNGKCILGDGLEYMKSIPDNTFDSVIVDIPYSGLGQNELQNMKVGGFRELNYNELMSADNFDTLAFVDELVRICNGNFIIFCGHEQLGLIRRYYNQHKKTLQMFRVLNWEKTNVSPMNMDKFFVCSNEIAVAFRKSHAYWGGNGELVHTLFKGKTTPNKKLHPTVKPQWLLQRLVTLTAPENGLVGDFCAGSLSLAEACTMTNRNYVCVEINEEYFNLGIEKRSKILNGLV